MFWATKLSIMGAQTAMKAYGVTEKGWLQGREASHVSEISMSRRFSRAFIFNP